MPVNPSFAYFKKIAKIVFGIFLGSSIASFAETSGKRFNDAVADAQTPRAVQSDRPEQKKTGHDTSDLFNAQKASPSSPALNNQPKAGKISGFDFYRDPLNADQPFQKPEDIMKQEIAGKSKVMAAQKELLEQRYNLTVKLDPNVTMSRGKPLAVGPTAQLSSEITWDELAGMSAYSGSKLPPIPDECCHSFHFKAATDSG